MERGTTSQAAAATGRLQTVGGFTLPVAAAYAASDVVPAQHTPDGVSDAERHQLADETIGDHECQRLRLGSPIHDASWCVRGGATRPPLHEILSRRTRSDSH